MKQGDLVNFVCNWASNYQEKYASPGIILEKHMETNGKGHYHILWSDKRITSEHESYLELVQKSSEYVKKSPDYDIIEL